MRGIANLFTHPPPHQDEIRLCFYPSKYGIVAKSCSMQKRAIFFNDPMIGHDLIKNLKTALTQATMPTAFIVKLLLSVSSFSTGEKIDVLFYPHLLRLSNRSSCWYVLYAETKIS